MCTPSCECLGVNRCHVHHGHQARAHSSSINHCLYLCLRHPLSGSSLETRSYQEGCMGFHWHWFLLLTYKLSCSKKASLGCDFCHYISISAFWNIQVHTYSRWAQLCTHVLHTCTHNLTRCTQESHLIVLLMSPAIVAFWTIPAYLLACCLGCESLVCFLELELRLLLLTCGHFSVFWISMMNFRTILKILFRKRLLEQKKGTVSSSFTHCHTEGWTLSQQQQWGLGSLPALRCRGGIPEHSGVWELGLTWAFSTGPTRWRVARATSTLLCLAEWNFIEALPRVDLLAQSLEFAYLPINCAFLRSFTHGYGGSHTVILLVF